MKTYQVTFAVFINSHNIFEWKGHNNAVPHNSNVSKHTYSFCL